MKETKKIKITIWIIIAILIIVFAVCAVLYGKKNLQNEQSVVENKPEPQTESNITENTSSIEEKEDENESSEKLAVVPTMKEKVSGDTAWCPTFQLVWNDMKNEVVKKDVEFIKEKGPDYLDNLNDELFTTDDISESLYYKKWGEKSNQLKEEILKGIKEKFNEKSDVIDEKEDWTVDDDSKSYIFYTMLKKEFNFLKEFDILEKDSFAEKYDNVEYFGIDNSSDEEISTQVSVLYYDNEDEFAISIETKENDEVIFTKKPEGKTFEEIYKEIEEKSSKFEGKKKMQAVDTLKIPNLDFNVLKEYKELKGEEFLTASGDIATIEKALQTIKLKLNNKGGEIKSEAVIDMKVTSAISEPEEIIPREIYLNDEFVMFVKEKDKELPYFALKVSDISKYQKNVKK